MTDTPTPGKAAKSTRSPLIKRVRTLVQQTRDAARAYDRPDLADRLEQRAARLDDPAFHVLVVGEFKQGKSTLVNALVGSPVCPVDDDIATAVPTSVRFGDPPAAAIYLTPPRSAADSEEAIEPERRDISVDDVPLYSTERQALDVDVQSVEVKLPSDRLSDGLILVDTPGVGGLGSMHSTITMGALPMAEAVLFVSDASQEFSAAEISFMQQAISLCPNLVCVLTKTDFYPGWRKIADLDRGHLERLGIKAEIIPVSSTLHVRAVEKGDEALDEESGFPALDDAFRKKIVARAEEFSARTIVTDVDAVLSQLEAHFQAEKAALTDPESVAQSQRDLEAAKMRADELKSRAARWQQTLSDGFTDLAGDLDHDLRGRFRLINQEVDAALDEIDPADTWNEFESWLYRRVAEDVVHNYRFLQARAHELSQQVAQHFELDVTQMVVDFNVGDPTQALGMARTDADIEVKKMGAGATVMTGVRGGYIGMLMFGVLGSMVGLALGPLPIGVGLLMGRKQVREEKNRQLTQRRTQAKTAQRRYMDEAQFLVSKEMRDAARRMNRNLRDYFTARAEEQSKSVNEQLAAVQKVARADQETRKKRLADVNAEVKRLSDLRGKMELAVPPAPQAAG
jgi:GTPase Era involved in 16S rRNA processing